MAPHEAAAPCDRSPTPDLTWQQLLTHCKIWRAEIRASLGLPFSRLSVSSAPDGSCRLYALGTPPSSSQQTLLTTEVPTCGTDAKLRPLLNPDQIKGSASLEFSLLCERQRMSVVSGVSEYSLHPRDRSVLMTTGGEIYRWNGVSGKDSQIHTIWGCPAGSFVADAQMCPSDSELVAFVAERQVHVQRSGRHLYATRSSSPTIANGVPSFISQEELDRFTGIWWSPSNTRLLYEQIDETKVPALGFDCPGKERGEPMRYPLVGADNATSTLRMILIDGERVHDVGLRVPLQERFPWIEYITRAGFLLDGKTVWLQAMNRPQNRCAIILIGEDEFEGVAPGGNTLLPSLHAPVIIYDEYSETWINTHNLIQPLPSSLPNRVRMLYSTELASHCHLCVLETEIRNDGSLSSTIERQVTKGDWSVCKSAGLMVDTHRNHVFFLANVHSPLEMNLCVTNFMDGLYHMNVLTDAGYHVRSERAHHQLSVTPGVGFCCWIGSIESPPVCRFFRLVHQDSESLTLPTAVPLCEVTMPGCAIPSKLIELSTPKVIPFLSKNSGQMHYALLVRPPCAREGTRYPVIQNVYGGPGIQLVKNDWASWVQCLKYAHLGFAVLMMDGRGSHNRGRDFETPLKGAMGTVEIEDQIECLREVSRRTGNIDLDRVAVQGWSYGGYLSLLSIAKYPQIYRVCIAGGAVTDWKLYDTAYTERYLGYPITDVYQKCSVTSLVDKLPDEPGKVMLVHGMIDENVHFRHAEVLIEAMIKAGKPYQLQVFPKERHGIRQSDGAAHLDASVVHFICNAFKNAQMSGL